MEKKNWLIVRKPNDEIERLIDITQIRCLIRCVSPDNKNLECTEIEFQNGDKYLTNTPFDVVMKAIGLTFS